MNKESHKEYLFNLASYYNKLDENMKDLINDYVNSLREDLILSNDIIDYKAKNAYRIAENSSIGSSNIFWKKIKDKLDEKS